MSLIATTCHEQDLQLMIKTILMKYTWSFVYLRKGLSVIYNEMFID